MRFSIIFLYAFWISCICHAQYILKINIGCSYNLLNTDVSNRNFTSNTNELGYSSGFQFKYDVTKVFGIETGISWIQKNYSFRRTETYSGIFDKFTNHYLQIPFKLQIKIFEWSKYQIFFNNGFFISYWTYAKVNGVIPNVFNTTSQVDTDGQVIQNFYFTNYSEKYRFIKQKDNRFEFGLQTGITLQYNLNDKRGCFIEYNYFHSLSDIQKKYMVNQISKINRTFLLSVGFLIKLSCKN